MVWFVFSLYFLLGNRINKSKLLQNKFSKCCIFKSPKLNKFKNEPRFCSYLYLYRVKPLSILSHTEVPTFEFDLFYPATKCYKLMALLFETRKNKIKDRSTRQNIPRVFCVNFFSLSSNSIAVLWPNLKNLSGGLNLIRVLNMFGST